MSLLHSEEWMNIEAYVMNALPKNMGSNAVEVISSFFFLLWFFASVFLNLIYILNKSERRRRR